MKKSFLKIFVLFFLVIFFSKYNISNASFIGTSPTVVATSTCSVGLSCGLVGYWTFDGKDIARGVLMDKSGYGLGLNTFNISTSTFYSQGKIGQGINFDASNDWLKGSTSPIYAPPNITISFWIKLFAPPPDNNGSIASKEWSTTGWRIRILTDKTLTFVWAGSSGAGSPALVLGRWTHVVGVADSTGGRFYIDSVAQTKGTNPYTGSELTAHSIAFNSNQDAGSNTHGNMMLDDFRIYNRILSASEISQLYSSGASNKQGASPTVTATSTCSVGLSCGLVGYWTFDGKDMVRGVAQDKSGNNNKGILENISTSTFYALGKIGQGFNFDGSNDYMRTGVIKTPSFVGSISMWVQRNNTENTNYLFDSRGTSNGGAGYAYILSGLGNVVTPSSGTVYLNGRLESATNRISTTSSWYHVVISGITLDINQDLKIATRFGGAESPWKGKIDDFRIYDRTLSASEVSQLYSSGASTKQGSSPTVTATSTCSVGLSCGLIGYWTFDGKDMVRGVARDMSGSGNHANLISISTSTFYTRGKIGQGFNFDNLNDSANLSTNILANRSSFSIMMWARKNKSAIGSLFSSFSGGPYWRVTFAAGNTLFYLEKSDCTSGISRDEILFNDDKFHHVGITMDPTGVYRIFKDGVQVYTATYAGWDYVCADATDWRSIGSYAASNTFGGVIDDVRIYGRDISATEVKQLYNMGK